MCSIAGGFIKSEVEHMLSVMKHRAPDDSGTITANDFTIGMGRLKILDLVSPGLCPLEMEGLILAFNGELYNYLELREELTNLGYAFTTESDSEVLLKAYKEWGPGCLDKFNGMFAFAIYDGETVFLARDIAGEKPLYFTGNPFRFSSEAKALQFKCHELLPGCWASYNLSRNSIDVNQYWKPNYMVLDTSLDEAVKQLDSLMEDSVRLRTRAHVPYGLYLSGGIDSTLISTYHNFKETFTYTKGSQKEFLDIFPKVLWHLDYPVSTFTPYALYKLAQEALGSGVKVVLSGEGADELFGGYVRYVPNEFNRKAREVFPSYTDMFPYRDMMAEEFSGNMRELLRMGDRMAAAWGIENRCPFLDRRIIEFANSLPMHLKIDGYKTKIVPNELLKRRKPDYQPIEKAGLYVPVNEWIGSQERFSKYDYKRYQEDIWQRFSVLEVRAS